MLRKGGLVWTKNTLTPGMATLTLRVRTMVTAAMQELAAEMKDYAQQNAPWEDRSGEARAGLEAEVHEFALNPTIVLYHQVDYGLWLEVRWSGRYAIIVPTIEHFSQGRVMRTFSLGKVV